MTAPLALATLAVALAWPIPLLLARATWPARAPAAALLLWQSIAIAGGLSMIGALLTFGLAPFGDDLVSGAVGLATRGVLEVSLPHALALAGAALLAFHLLLNLTLTIVRSERQRRRHAQLLFLLSSPLPSGSRMTKFFFSSRDNTVRIVVAASSLPVVAGSASLAWRS